MPTSTFGTRSTVCARATAAPCGAPRRWHGWSASSRSVAHGNILVTAREVDDLGPEAALDHVPDGASIFLSLDCDGLDPTVLPAVRAPLPGGLSYRQAAELVRRLADRGRIVGMALTELVPSLDATGLSALVAVRLIVQLIGAMRRSGQIG
jgi:agmatinase